MTVIYKVAVEHNGQFYREIMTAAKAPELAAEAAERIAAKDIAGEDWLVIAHEFFASRVRETTARDLPWLKR